MCFTHLDSLSEFEYLHLSVTDNFDKLEFESIVHLTSDLGESAHEKEMLMIAKRMHSFGHAIGLVAGFSTPALADATEDFCKTRTLTVFVGSSAGGVFDLYGRRFTKFLRNHLPRAPNVIVQNMSGAASLTAANDMSNVAAKDGNVRSLARAPVMELLEGTSSSAFNPQKLEWIGDGAAEPTVCGISQQLPCGQHCECAENSGDPGRSWTRFR